MSASLPACDGAEIVFAVEEVCVVARVRHERIFPADRVLHHELAVAGPQQLAGDGPSDRRKRPELIDFERVGAKAPVDAAVLHRLEVRHRIASLTETPDEGGAGNHTPRVDRHPHAELPQPFELVGRHLLHVHERPALAADGHLARKRLNLLQLFLDGPLLRRVDHHWNPGLRDRLGHATPFVPGGRLNRRLRVVDVVRHVDEPLAPVDVIDPLVTVKESKLRDLRDDLVGVPPLACGRAEAEEPHRHRLALAGSTGGTRSGTGRRLPTPSGPLSRSP